MLDHQAKSIFSYRSTRWLEHAVARGLARWGDFGIFFLFLRLVLRPLRLHDWPYPVDWYGALAASVIANSLSIWLTKTTICKAALGLRVERADGSKPALSQSILREILVTGLGMGGGVPVMALCAGAYWGRRLHRGQRTYWNYRLGLISVRTEYLEQLHSSRRGTSIAVVWCICFIVGSTLVIFAAARPTSLSLVYGF